jgi:1,4-dihydroxy-2-naphthoate polyprenyltransferase
VSKWLVITRSCVFSMTVVSAFLGGTLAAIDGHFSPGLWLLVTLGLILAHAANNMVNDFFDTEQGIDTEDYPRAAYAPHPLLDGLVSRNGLLAAILICNLLDLVIAVILTRTCGAPVMFFAVAGLLTSVFYVAPPLKLKQRGLGEPAIFLIWGPLMIAGTYFVLCGSVPLHVWLASVPYGLAVTTALMGKHMDKADKDREKGVATLPVLLGRKRALQVTGAMVWAFYLLIVSLAAAGTLPVFALLVLVSLPKATRFLVTLQHPMPPTPLEAFRQAEDVIPRDLKARFDPTLPAEQFPLWPLWYVVWGVWWTRSAGAWFAVGLLLAAFWRFLFGG